MSAATTETALCACGCGEPTPLAQTTNRARGRIRGEPQRFCHGHGNRGPNGRNGSRHYAWKGDEAGYNAVHTWMRKTYPKTGTCEECGEARPTDWANVSGEYRRQDRSDWRELCKPCHAREDRRNPKRRTRP